MARPLSDIDPKREIVDGKRKRKRRKQGQPPPPENLKAGEAKALTRAEKRPVSPGVMLEPKGEHGWQYTSPHSDQDLWKLQVADAFGTRSRSVMDVFLRDLRKLAAQDYDEDLQRWKANETELNAALAMVADIQPRNTAEAALAAQMVAVHWMQMRLTSQALNNGGMVMEKDAALASKMARTFTMQLEALQSLRGGKKTSRQSIKVTKETHQHVHYHKHGEPEENGGQLHEPPRVIDDRKALPGPNKGGDVVPLSRATGKK